MDKLATILDAARTLSPDERRRLIVDLEAHSSTPEDREQAVKKLLELSRRATSGSGGRRWTREELQEPDALEETMHSSDPTSREPFAALRALSGTAHSDFTNISTDKYAHVAAAAVETLNEVTDRS